MEPGIVAVFIPIFAVIGFFTMIVYLRRYENLERMAMIEKGVDPALFARQVRRFNGTLQFACLFIGVGLGLLFAYLLDSITNMDEVAYFASLFIFGGIGLLMAYLVEERKAKHENLLNK